MVFWWFLQTYMTSGPCSSWFFLVMKSWFFWCYSGLQAMAIHCRAAKNSLRGTIYIYVALLWNFFILREAATAKRRYEKERQSVNYMHTAAFGARTNLFSPLPALPLPLSHPPPINAIRGAGLHLFPSPPSHPLRIVTSFLRPRPKSRMASI